MPGLTGLLISFSLDISDALRWTNNAVIVISAVNVFLAPAFTSFNQTRLNLID